MTETASHTLPPGTSERHTLPEHPHRPASRVHRLMDALPLLALEAGLILAWSSGFIGMRFTTDHAPVFTVLLWRCMLVAIVLSPWVVRGLRAVPASVLLHHAAIGFLSMALYLACVARAIELGVSSGFAALIADLMPIGTALLATVVYRARLSARVWAGLAIGLVGVLIVGHDVLAAGDAPLWAYALPFVSMLALAIATLWQKRTQRAQALGVLPTLWVQCVISGVAFGAVAAYDGEFMPVFTPGFAAATLWMAVLATLGGYGLYWICLRRSSPTRVASVLYLSPGATVLWAWAMFGEPLTWRIATGVAISAVGVWLVIRASPGEQIEPPRRAGVSLVTPSCAKASGSP